MPKGETPMTADSSAGLVRLARDALFAAVIASLHVPAPAAEVDAPSNVVVAWNDGPTSEGHIRSFPAAAPWDFDTPALNVGANLTLHVASELVYAVSRTDATVAVIDPGTWTVLRTLSVGVGRQPVDIAVIAADLAYVSCADETHLLRFNPITGETARVVDLSIFADMDGVPDLNMMAVHEGRLFVQLRRIDTAISPVAFVQPAMLAVVDLATETVIDAEPVAMGVQAIELEGMAPKFKMQIVEATRRLFVSASGDFFDEGGIEMIDLDTLESLGLIVREADGTVGADLGAIVLVTPDRGYLTFSTDFATSSHLVEFTVSGGVVPGGALFETVGYFVPTLPHDPQSGTFYFPNGGFPPSSVVVLDAASAAYVATVEIGNNAYPTDVVVIPAEPAIPAASAWGVLILGLLVAIAASALLARRACRTP
jgi:hypothetical protein